MPQPRLEPKRSDRKTRMVSTCSWCRRIRDKAGGWHVRTEAGLDRTQVEFSHGICDECAKALYPQYFVGSR